MNFINLDIPTVLTYLEQIYARQKPGFGWNVIYFIDSSPNKTNKFLAFKSFDELYQKMSKYPKFTLLWAKILQQAIDDGKYENLEYQIMQQLGINDPEDSRLPDAIAREAVKQELKLSGLSVGIGDPEFYQGPTIIFSSDLKAANFYQQIMNEISRQAPQFHRGGGPHIESDQIGFDQGISMLEINSLTIIQLLDYLYKQQTNQNYSIVYLVMKASNPEHIANINFKPAQFLAFPSFREISPKLVPVATAGLETIDVQRLQLYGPTFTIMSDTPHILSVNYFYQDELRISIQFTFSSAELAGNFRYNLILSLEMI